MACVASKLDITELKHNIAGPLQASWFCEGGDDDTGFILSESIASNSVTDAITLTIQQLPENTTLVKVFGDGA